MLKMLTKFSIMSCLIVAGCASTQNKMATHAADLSSTPITLSCEMVRDLCYLKGGYNSLSNLWLVLDTGSSQSVLNSSKKALLGLNPINTGRAGGPGSDDSNNYTEFNSIDILAENKIVLRNQSVLSLPFDYVSQQNGHPTDGTLGGNLFLNYSVAIDYTHNSVTLDKNGIWKRREKEQLIPITLDESVPVVKATILLGNGKNIDGNFLIDTGQSGTGLVIFEPFLKVHPELNRFKTRKATDVTLVGGKLKLQPAKIPKLRIGSFIAKNVSAVFPIGASGVYAKSGLSGAIGPSVLNQFNVVFDYFTHRMILSPHD